MVIRCPARQRLGEGINTKVSVGLRVRSKAGHRKNRTGAFEPTGVNVNSDSGLVGGDDDLTGTERPFAAAGRYFGRLQAHLIPSELRSTSPDCGSTISCFRPSKVSVPAAALEQPPPIMRYGGEQQTPARVRRRPAKPWPGFDTAFDFESANARFEKEHAEHKPVYSKEKGFFDSMSVNEGNGMRWNEERSLNMDTFGQASVRRGRGNFRGRGRGNFRGRGRGRGRGKPEPKPEWA
ncbi:hypothetical protein E0198_002989 [Clavispora lusitaniae]|nr:hypothetical protein E0198_002989 [Clavispora lusitaniae]